MSEFNFDKFVKSFEEKDKERLEKIKENKKNDENWPIRKLLNNGERTENNIVYGKNE